MENHKTRVRAPNFTSIESHHLCEVLEKYKHIIENKRTDGASLRDKQKAWLKVVDEYNSTTTAYSRTLDSLQQCYKNIKKKAKKQLSSVKMNIPVNREMLIQSMEQHGPDNWQKISDCTGVSQSTCQEEFEDMKKEAKKLVIDIKKDVLATGGGPSTHPKEDPLLDKVCSLVGPTLDGLYTIYDGDSDLMATQGTAPIEAINSKITLPLTLEKPEDETACFFDNDRSNLKRKPHPKLVSTKKIKTKEGNESVSDKFKTLAKEKMEIVSLQKELLKKQLKFEDERFTNMQLENQILKEKLAHAQMLRSAAEIDLEEAKKRQGTIVELMVDTIPKL